MGLKIYKHDFPGRNGKAVLDWFDWIIVIVGAVGLAGLIDVVLCVIAPLLGGKSAFWFAWPLLSILFWRGYRWLFFKPDTGPVLIKFLNW